MSEGTFSAVLDGSASWSIAHGDSFFRLLDLPPNSVDSMVADPPAGISFMNREWDRDKGGMREWINWLACIMDRSLRAMKPGAHGFVWALPRTSHWTGMALEYAGFEIRGQIQHWFGSGFPKSLNLRDEWAGWGTALKPANEVWWIVRKPLERGLTVAENVAKWGTGALNIDGCRVAHAGADDLAAHQAQVEAIKARGGSMDNSWKNSSDLAGASEVSLDGRWPPDVLLTHDGRCRKAGSIEVAAHPTWDTQNRETESAFTGSEVSKVRHANGRNGEASSDKRYADQGSTSFAPLPGARRADTETIDRWECVSAGSATVPSFSFRTRTSEPANAHDTLDLLRLALACMLSSGTGDKDREPGASELCRTSRTFEAVPASLGAAAHALGLTVLPGFLADCPSCRGSGDEHVRRLVAGAQGGPAQLAGALALVIRLAESDEHSRTRPPSDLRSSSGGSRLANGEPDTSANRSDGAPPASGSSGSAPRTARRVRKERAQSEPPLGTHESSTCAHDGSRASASHSGRNADCIRTLVTLALELAWLFVPQLEREDSTISWSSCPVRELAAQSGESLSSGGSGIASQQSRIHGGGIKGGMGANAGGLGDSGSAARYFPQFEWTELDDIFRYVPKPARSERDAGLDHFRHRSGAEMTGSEEGQARLNSPRSGAGRKDGARNSHPTVKGQEFLRYICRLGTPPRGIVLTPFGGVGSECLAAVSEGFRAIGIELNDTDKESFVSIARARLHHAEGREFVPRESLRASEPPRQAALFRTESA